MYVKHPQTEKPGKNVSKSIKHESIQTSSYYFAKLNYLQQKCLFYEISSIGKTLLATRNANQKKMPDKLENPVMKTYA